MTYMQWASYHICKIAGCACAGNAGNVFPATDFKWNRWLPKRHASRHVRHARAMMHVGIANPRCREKRSRHSRRMRNPQFYVSGKRPMFEEHVTLAFCLFTLHHKNCASHEAILCWSRMKSDIHYIHSGCLRGPYICVINLRADGMEFLYPFQAHDCVVCSPDWPCMDLRYGYKRQEASHSRNPWSRVQTWPDWLCMFSSPLQMEVSAPPPQKKKKKKKIECHLHKISSQRVVLGAKPPPPPPPHTHTHTHTHTRPQLWSEVCLHSHHPVEAWPTKNKSWLINLAQTVARNVQPCHTWRNLLPILKLFVFLATVGPGVSIFIYSNCYVW